MNISQTYINIIEHPAVDATINFLKKFKSSKSYWSVSYLILLFTLREAIAWKFGSAIKIFCEEQVVDSSFPIVWKVIGFVLDVGGSWELVALGTFLFVVLSLTKASEGETHSSKGSYLMIVLFSILGIALTPLYYLYQGNDIKTIIENNNEKLDELLKRTEEKNISVEDVKVLQNISGVIKNEKGENIEGVTIFLKKTEEEIKSKDNGKYIFENILGNENEKTELILSKSGCDTRTVSISLGQKRDIVLSCINIKKG